MTSAIIQIFKSVPNPPPNLFSVVYHYNLHVCHYIAFCYFSTALAFYSLETKQGKQNKTKPNKCKPNPQYPRDKKSYNTEKVKKM